MEAFQDRSFEQQKPWVFTYILARLHIRVIEGVFNNCLHQLNWNPGVSAQAQELIQGFRADHNAFKITGQF